MPKIFIGESFHVSLISGTEKSWESEGEEVSKFCVESSWSHSAEKKHRGNPLVFPLFRVSKKIG